MFIDSLFYDLSLSLFAATRGNNCAHIIYEPVFTSHRISISVHSAQRIVHGSFDEQRRATTNYRTKPISVSHESA